MQKNVGGMDRTVRLVVGPLLVLVAALGYTGTGFELTPLIAGLLGLVGLVLLGTGLTQKCIINKLLDLDTYTGSR